MATQDRSPSLFAGQPWSVWAENVPFVDDTDTEDRKKSDKKGDDSDSMKLRKDDMAIFGLCPAQDEFFLVVCEKCNQVIKPQALKRHMDSRHGIRGKVEEPPKSLSMPTKESISFKSTPPRTKASVKEPPIFLASVTPKMTGHAAVNPPPPTQLKKSHPMPVVKVERISEQLTMKKTLSVNQETNVKPTLTNGTIKSLSCTMASPTPPVSQPPPLTAAASPVTVVPTMSKMSVSSLTASSTATVTTTTTTSTATKPAVTSSNKKSPKERKFLPCKDREFDADKHCGCWITDIAKQCTRSLTCKTHALSLRRAVKGRSKTFDELLKEHRAAKEASLKAKAENAAKAAAGGGGGGGGGGAATSSAASVSQKSGHTDSNAHSKEGVSMSKVPHPPSLSPQKVTKVHNKPHNSVFQRLTSGIYGSPLTVKEEPSSSQDVSGRLTLSSDADVESDDHEKADATYLPYHPQPAAVCRFGARYNGSGCYAFSRKVDYVRAAFLSALERHLHPPPHKKLCVESNLPKEPQVVTNSKDPYEFNMVDTTASSTHSFSSVLNSSSKSALKQKSKSSSSSRTSKTRENSGARSPGSSSGSSSGGGNPAKRKRSGGSQGGGSATPTCTMAPSPAMSNVIGSMAALNSHTNSPITAIAIPNFSGTTLGHFNATLSSNKQSQVPKNNIIKDFNLVLTGIDPSMVNGQYMNITGTQLADLAAQAHVVGSDDKSAKRSRTVSGNSKNSSTGKLTNNLEAFKALSNNSVINLPQNAVLMDSALPGTMLATASVSLTSGSSSTIVSLGNTTVSPPQSSPSMVPSPMFRTDSMSPQVSLSSPLPNGFVPSPTDKSGGGQRHSANLLKQSHNKGVTMNVSSGLLHTTSGQVGSASHMLPSQGLTNAQLTQLQQMKQGTLNMTKNMAGKITMPMSVTIPLMSQAGLVAAPQTPHTLLVTTSGEDGTTKQELHLQQPISNSPSNVIS